MGRDREEGVEVGARRGALHRAPAADGEGAGGVGEAERFAGGRPRSQQVTKVPAKVSPAPVGSISSTGKAGQVSAVPGAW